MSGVLETLRSGDWLTFDRARLWAIAVLIASAGGLAYLLATSDGLIDYQGRPLGTDFSNVYTAGRMVLEGEPAAAFDPRLEHAREQQIFGEKTPFYGWHYPAVLSGAGDGARADAVSACAARVARRDAGALSAFSQSTHCRRLRLSLPPVGRGSG